MPLIDLVDETFVVADPAVVAQRVRDPERWREWWPDLELTVAEDRELKGIRWTVAGTLVGTAEIWLEPWEDGVILHWYLRVVPAHGDPEPRKAARVGERLRRRYATDWKRHAFALKDDLETGRPPGAGRR